MLIKHYLFITVDYNYITFINGQFIVILSDNFILVFIFLYIFNIFINFPFSFIDY